MKTYDELLALITQRGVHPVFGAGGEGWFIEQNPDELARFLVEMQKLGVQSVLEIGTGYKAGLARFLHDEMGWQVVSVDVHDYGHDYEGISFLTPATVKMSGQIDLIIFDADHTYEAVKADDKKWRSHASKAIMFHDIAGLRDCEGAKQYWDEIAYQELQSDDLDTELRPGYHEIIADGDQRGGIGYIVLSETEHHARAKAPAKKPAPRTKAAAKK